ncbi:Ig-specific serine endopeptidase MIP [Mycoplasma elephantis]|uniref:Ig-specific serine endopeptidase MIP n=1 Tax=Mycoplasma elephantis TaxID=114882 RepID=UPI00068CBECB|nr:DUF31 family protein [Mycoplasma elephantis]
MDNSVNEYINHIKTTKLSTGTSGTMWIMDYEINNGEYPTKWYFGTNLHVADALTNSTQSISLVKLLESVGIKTTLKLTSMDKNFKKNIMSPKDGDFLLDNGLKTVYRGVDFLKQDPSDYLVDDQKNLYKNNKEFIDFAVIEIDFEKINFDDKNKTPQEFAKWLTNNYANRPDQQIKFKSKTYLNEYEQINVPIATSKDPNLTENWWTKKDELIVVGYPSAKGDYFLKQYVDDDQIKRQNEMGNFSLWTNSDYRFYDQLSKSESSNASSSIDEKSKRGNYLSYNIGYRTYSNKPGICDSFLTVPVTGSELYKSSDNNSYITMGLEYIIKHYAPVGGASGSSVRNQNNELVGVYHVSNATAHTGLAAAFRSEGYNYNGLFGEYNLPQYDLIYGGGKDQKNSYKKAMQELYGASNIKTNLFKDGVNAQTPDDFKF